MLVTVQVTLHYSVEQNFTRIAVRQTKEENEHFAHLAIEEGLKSLVGVPIEHANEDLVKVKLSSYTIKK